MCCVALEPQRWILRKFVQDIEYYCCKSPSNDSNSIRLVTSLGLEVTSLLACSTKQTVKAVREMMRSSTCTEPRDLQKKRRSAGKVVNQTRDVHTKELLIASEHRWCSVVSAFQHGDMCGLNAIEPFDARTPPPPLHPCPHSCAKEQKQLPTVAKTASKAWACAIAADRRRLEGYDKSWQAHQADWRVATRAGRQDYVDSLYYIGTY